MFCHKMEKKGLEKMVLSHTHDMENTENKTNCNDASTKENGLFLSPTDAMEYRAYKKQKKIGEISLAMSRSCTPIRLGEDAQRICERAVRIRQAAVKAPLTSLLSVKEYLTRNKMRMDCVIGGNGEHLTKVKAYEIKLARKNGVAEVTVAITPSLMSACRYTEIKRELKKLRRAAKNMSLKVWVDKKHSFPAIARVARICCEVGAQYVCVPHFDGCERLRYDLTRGCLLEVSEVNTLEEYKRLAGAGVGRIVVTRPWDIYNEWLKEAEKIEIGKVSSASQNAQKTEKVEDKMPQIAGEKPITAQTKEVKPVLPPKPALPALKTDGETNYRCRLEGTELKFL